MGLKLLGGLSVARFLGDYWQKKPLLVRGAWPGLQDPLSPEDLAGLACEEEVESRLVLEQGGARPWDLRRGPFSERDFLALPDSHWSLLVQDVEKHMPALSELIEPFRFIPDWRIDDLMISYAPIHGSVGPHTDDYDVFLLQAMGRRRWQIGAGPITEAELLPDTELRILRYFTPDQEWVLERGDLLYLPPRIGHYGVALEPCMTYSIGFRAPSERELLEGFLDFVGERVEADARYHDPDLAAQANPGLIAADALTTVQRLLQQRLAFDDETIARWFGRFTTTPKPPFGAEPLEEPLSVAELEAHLREGGVVERNPGSRFAYIERGPELTLLFIDGQEFALGAEVAWLAPLLCRRRTFTRAQLGRALRQAEAGALLLDLVNEGWLVIYEDE